MARGFLAALTRRRLIGGAGAVALLPPAARTARATALTDPSSSDLQTLRTELVLEIRAVTSAKGVVGTGSGGVRLIPLAGGSFVGPRLRGVLEQGTIEWHPDRPDGTILVEGHCDLRCEDGERLSFTGRGLCSAGEPVIRTVPELAAAPGRHPWLDTAVLVGALDARGLGDGSVVMRVFRVI